MKASTIFSAYDKLQDKLWFLEHALGQIEVPADPRVYPLIMDYTRRNTQLDTCRAWLLTHLTNQEAKMLLTKSNFEQDAKMQVAIINLDVAEVLRYVRENFSPDQVFEDAVLEQWALDYGMEYDYVGCSDEDEQRVRY